MAFIKGIILRSIERAGYSVIHVDALKRERAERAWRAPRPALAPVTISRSHRVADDPLFTHRIANYGLSPVFPLITPNDLKSETERLRANLASDKSAAAREAVSRPEIAKVLALQWWQRLAIPGTDTHTTSDHSRLAISNPGWLNTLGDALTPEEGFVLRPMPKWSYLGPIFPEIAGKSLLEIGSNNGYFCFEFLDRGARHVTGLEVHKPFVDAAQWMKAARGIDNAHFVHTDALLNLNVPRHDIVFMSEVHAHFVDPLFGILRAVNLASETLVIDGAAVLDEELKIDIGAGVDPATGKLTYHSWIMSDGLMLSYLTLCGVPPEKVKRYIAPWPSHVVYVIDTRDVAAYRHENEFQACNTSFLELGFTG